MTELKILAWLSPVILIVLTIGLVATIAIRRADTKDIPAIVKDVMATFHRIGVNLPGPGSKGDIENIDGTSEQCTDDQKATIDVRPSELQKGAESEIDSGSK